jgi:hypothetical protein
MAERACRPRVQTGFEVPRMARDDHRQVVVGPARLHYGIGDVYYLLAYKRGNMGIEEQWSRERALGDDWPLTY